MSEDYQIAGRGLKYVFIGEILSIFALIPVVGAILSVIACILVLVGLYTAGKVHPGLKTAFTVTVVNLIVSAISAFLGGALSIVTTILSMIQTYYILTATADLLRSKGDTALSERGQKVWKLLLYSMVVSIVCMLLAFIPILGIAALIVMVIACIVYIVATIMYVIFIYNAQASLLS